MIRNSQRRPLGTDRCVKARAGDIHWKVELVIDVSRSDFATISGVHDSIVTVTVVCHRVHQTAVCCPRVEAFLSADQLECLRIKF